MEGFKPSQWEICPQPNFRGLRVWTPLYGGKSPQLEGFKHSQWKIPGPTQFQRLEGLDPENSGLTQFQWFEGLDPPPTDENQFQFFTGFSTVSIPNWNGLNRPSGKFWAQPNFRGLKAWTPPYRTEENKFQFCTGFWTVWTRNWKGLNRPSWKFWAQPNFRGLEVWTSPMRRKTIFYFYWVLDGLDPQLERFKPSQWKILGPT